MKYKALFLDVDGTTVVHGVDNLPSSRVVDAIHACKKAGVSVCLATSRPLSAARLIIEHLDLTGFCVISSGTQIYDPQKKKIVIEKLFPKKPMKTILESAKEHGVEVKVFDGEREVPYDGVHYPKKVVGMYFPKLEPSVLQEIQRKLEKLPGISFHRMEAWDERFECLDIVNDQASKLHGIVEVAKMLNIQTHEMIGVGDGYNDFPLLMACGLKIAMGNAVPELKTIADFIAPSVQDDGVATVIEKFILNE